MGVRILRCETVCSGPDSHRANLVLSQPDGGRSERCSIMAPASNLGLAGDLRTDEIVGNWRSQRKPWDGNRTRTAGWSPLRVGGVHCQSGVPYAYVEGCGRSLHTSCVPLGCASLLLSADGRGSSRRSC